MWSLENWNLEEQLWHQSLFTTAANNYSLIIKSQVLICRADCVQDMLLLLLYNSIAHFINCVAHGKVGT